MKSSSLLLATLLSLSLPATRAMAADAAAPDARRVSVSGNGEVSAMPDRARLTMSIEVSRPDIKSARSEADRVMRAYLAQARALGAKDEDINSTGFNLQPQFDYSKHPEAPKLVGYQATRGIDVLVRNLDHLGDFLQAATDAGINTVSPPQLESSRADALNRDALAKAALDARAKAQVLAETLGAKLGAVHSINATTEDAVPPRPMVAFASKSAAGGGNEDMGVNVGEIRIQATLTAEFDLVSP